MDKNRILGLALEELQNKRARIEQEIEMVQAELTGRGSTVREKASVPAAGAGRGRLRTPAERKAHSEAMRKYWAAKRGKAAKVGLAPKTSAVAGAKGRRQKTAAEKKALSLKLKAIWKKRKAAAAKNAKAI
jgi:hypothetical protein